VTAKDLTAIATCCPQLESLAFSNFRVDAEVDHRYRNALPATKKWKIAKIVERPDPKDLSNAPISHRIRDSNSRPPDLELGTPTKWLASRMLVRVSAGFSTVLPPVLLWCCTWA
jgi:hypothetical protein